MRATAAKLCACIAAIPIAMVLTRITGSGWFMALLLPAFVLMVLYAMDLAGELRRVSNPSGIVRLAALAASVPQVLFGLVTLGIGLAMIAWVLYNSFVQRLPGYSGGFMTFGIGPTCVLFGAGWIASAFRKD